MTAERAGLEIIGLHWLLVTPPGLYLTSPDDFIQRRTADYFIDLVRLCADFGGNVCVLGSPQQRNLLPGVDVNQALDFAEQTLQRALPEAERCGVTIAIEPLAPEETDFIRTAVEGIELVKRLNHPNFGLHLDTKAMVASETRPLDEVIQTSRDHLVHFHANDPNLLGPGMGELDYRPILAALKDVSYAGYVSVEVFDYRPGPEAIAEKSLCYLQQIDAAQRR